MKDDTEMIGEHLCVDSTHRHGSSATFQPYLQLFSQLLHMGGVLRQILLLGGVRQDGDCCLCLLEPSEERLQLPERHLNSLELTIQLDATIIHPVNTSTSNVLENSGRLKF